MALRMCGPILIATLFASPALVLSQPAAPVATGDAPVSQGQALFLQRCALCHLSPDGWRKNGLAPSIGPSLTGVMKDGSSEREAVVREKIRRGSAAMPGFQYGLDAQQLDRVLAYLKTLQ